LKERKTAKGKKGKGKKRTTMYSKVLLAVWCLLISRVPF